MVQVEWSQNDLEQRFLLNGFLVNPDTSCSTPQAFTTYSRKGPCMGEFIQTSFQTYFEGDFWVDFLGAFSSEKGKNPPQNPQQNSNRTLGASRPKSTLQGSGLDTVVLAGIIPRDLGRRECPGDLGTPYDPEQVWNQGP